jgi:hypothetical protein
MQRRKKIQRIMGTHKGMIHGRSPAEIVSIFRKAHSARGVPISHVRIYQLEEAPIKYFVKDIDNRGQQRLHQITNVAGKLEFRSVGLFSPNFSTREIFEDSLKGRTIGVSALKTYLALERGRGKKEVSLRTARASTLRLFLRNGFTIVNWDEIKNHETFSGVSDPRAVLKQAQPFPEDLGTFVDVQRILVPSK